MERIDKEKLLLRVIEISKKFIAATREELSYLDVTDYMRELSGAKYVTFNLYNSEKSNFKTVALSADKGITKPVIEAIGFNVVGQEWSEGFFAVTTFKDETAVVFQDLESVIKSNISSDRIKIIQKTLKIGQVVIINIIKGNEIMGAFILLMKKDKDFNDNNISELYASQVALLMAKTEVARKHLIMKKEYERFFTVNLDLFCIVELSGKFVKTNESWERLLGYSSAYLKDKNFIDFVHPEDIEKTKDIMAELEVKGEVYDFVNRYRCKDGSYSHVEWIAQKHGDNVYGSGRDITIKYERQKQIEFLSFYDYLTGLYNRRYMEDALKRLNSPRNLPLTLIALDINGLNLVNNAFGHKAGDRLIKQISDIIVNTSRPGDVAGRVGGDEFIMLLPNTSAQEAQKIKESMLKQAKEMDSDSYVVSFAVGYAVKTKQSQDINQIENRADQMMYDHKTKYGKIMRTETVETVLSNIFSNDITEQVHAEQVSLYCEQIATAMGLSETDVKRARFSGILHDIGKIAIPKDILTKPGTLAKKERDEIKRHPITSYNILKSADQYASLAEIVLYHHERIDGKGYPEGLKGTQIPLLSRIIAVADAYEVMTSERSYKKMMTKEEAIAELKRCSGTSFDSEIVDIFIEKVIA